MVLEGARALLEDLGMPRRVAAEMGERGLRRGRWKGGLSLQVGWEARSFVERQDPELSYRLWILEYANSTEN